MFYKSEISEALMPKPAGMKKYTHIGVGRIVNLDRTGRVYLYDVYYNGKIDYRYCTDGDRYIVYKPGSNGWGYSNLGFSVNWCSCRAYDKATDEEAKMFFGKDKTAYQLIDSLTYNVNKKKREKRLDAAATKQERCIGMFPAISPDVMNWVDKRVFENYIFVSNKKKGKRKAVCDACGKDFEIKDAKHKSNGECPFCKRKSIYFLERYKDGIKIKKRINIFYKTKDYRLHRWTDVIKKYCQGAKQYEYFDYWYSGICFENSRCNFAYGECHNWGYMVKKDWLTPNSHADSYVYKKGLDEALGVEIERYMVDGEKYNVLILLNNLEKFPQTEYLLKGGMTALAHDVRYYHPGKDEKDFQEIFGVDKKYLPMIKKYNCNTNDLSVIEAISKYEHASEELFLLCKRKQICSSMIRNLKCIFPKTASLGKIIRYIDKQKGNAERVISCYRDYLYMAKELKVELRKKYDIYPKDLQAEHDRLTEKVNVKRNKKKNASFKRGINKIYKTVPAEFKNNQFCMVLPKAIEDFSKEGQELKICVGSAYYAEKHAKGNSFICFIRKAEEPNKSFVCCELDLSTYKIIQIHGYKNDVGGSLPAGTRDFAEKYLRQIKKFRKNLEKKGAISA